MSTDTETSSGNAASGGDVSTGGPTQQPQVNFIQPPCYCGEGSPSSWSKHFDRWKCLQGLSDAQACNAMPFYMKGSAKVWFDSLPNATQVNYQQLKDALVARFSSSPADDEIVISQAAHESALEYIDKLTVLANSNGIPENLIVRIAKNRFNSALIPHIIQRDPKTLKDLKDAAVIAEKCVASKLHSHTPSVNATVDDQSYANFQKLENSICALTKKVEELQTNQSRPKFGKQGYEQRRPNFGAQGQTQPFGRQGKGGNSPCRSCNDKNCSGNRATCSARDLTCYKCGRKGHVRNKCASTWHIDGTRLRH